MVLKKRLLVCFSVRFCELVQFSSRWLFFYSSFFLRACSSILLWRSALWALTRSRKARTSASRVRSKAWSLFVSFWARSSSASTCLASALNLKQILFHLSILFYSIFFNSEYNVCFKNSYLRLSLSTEFFGSFFLFFIVVFTVSSWVSVSTHDDYKLPIEIDAKNSNSTQRNDWTAGEGIL